MDSHTHIELFDEWNNEKKLIQTQAEILASISPREVWYIKM
jgi:hypothetical protein